MLTRATRAGLLLLAALALAACAAQPAPNQAGAPTAMSGDMAGMDHGAMAGGAPYDAQFIDSMIVHHQGAIDMAGQALQQAERAELKALAEAVIAAQTAEIAQMRAWRAAWYPDLPETEGMGMAMGDMAIADDPGRPFDQRFIEAMIAHHEGAIAMAKDALDKAEHQEIRALAQAIVSAQEAEIAQMRQWQGAWFSQ